jgi:GT2 family glycosyltransferase
MSDPRLGVVIITRNRPAVITAIERALKLPARPPVVVVDNDSTDGTPDLVRRRFPKVQLIRLPENRGAAARNVGVAALDRPYIAFCDDDVWWEPAALTAGANLLDRNSRLAIISARVLVGDDQTLDPTCGVMAASPLPCDPHLPGRPILGFLAGATLLRRHAFIEAGGFEQRFLIGGEEELLALRLAEVGWSLAYVEEMVAHHHPSPLRSRDRQWIRQRNALWTAWMRRPARRAVAQTMRAFRAALVDPAARRALIGAAAGAPWALGMRRPLPRFLEDRVRLLESSS